MHVWKHEWERLNEANAEVLVLKKKVSQLREALEWYSEDPSSQGDVARAALKENQL